MIHSFDDLSIGQEFRSGGRRVTEEDIRQFADVSGDRNPLHLDATAAAAGIFGQRVAHGLLGLAIMGGLSSDAPRLKDPVLIQLDNWKFSRPVFIDDTLSVTRKVIDKREDDRRPGRGIVQWYIEVVNQQGEVVQKGAVSLLIGRKETAS